jgi:hypothetical protein
MPLNLSVGEGDFTPYLKYNAKAGRFYVKPEGATEEVEIVNPFLAIDMANIKTGWLYYAEGSGPEKVWDPSSSQMAPRPPGPKKFKRGFEVMVYGNAIVPSTNKMLGLREFSSTAGNVISAILRMYAEYEAGAANNPGCVPAYTCNGVKPINGAYGVNYEPLFELRQWVPRAKIPAFDEHAAGQADGAPPVDDIPPANGPDDFGLPPVAGRRGSVKDQLLDDNIPF